MKNNPFQRAERRRAKLRLGVIGPAGSGKTFSALQIAMGLGGTIAIIDTEHGSAELYAHLCVYDVATLSPPFTPKRYLELIHFAEKSYDIVIVDSLSHAWAGEGGLLEMHGNISGNSYTAWKTVTPHHLKLVEAMLQSPAHIIATMRSKTEYVLEENERGKKVPRKVGMAPVQRAGMDYEFTTVFDLNDTHFAKTSKDRTGLFDGDVFQPSPKTGEALLEWLNSGGEPVERAIVEEKPEPKKPEPEKPKTVTKPEPKKASVNPKDKLATIKAKKAAWAVFLEHADKDADVAKANMKSIVDKPSSKYTVGDIVALRKWLVGKIADKKEAASPDEKVVTETPVAEDDLPFDAPTPAPDKVEPAKSATERLQEEKEKLQNPTPITTPEKVTCPTCGLGFSGGHPPTCPDCGEALS